MDETFRNSPDWLQDNNYTHESIDEYEIPFGGPELFSFGSESFMDPGHVGYSRVANGSIFSHSDSETITHLPKENSMNSATDPSSQKAGSDKPLKRRSRASRRTPPTLLNANTSNFRALVQQYTGCQTSGSKNQKGPINLSFGSVQQIDRFEEVQSLHETTYEAKYEFQEADRFYHQQNLQDCEVKGGLFSYEERRGYN